MRQAARTKRMHLGSMVVAGVVLLAAACMNTSCPDGEDGANGGGNGTDGAPASGPLALDQVSAWAHQNQRPPAEPVDYAGFSKTPRS